MSYILRVGINKICEAFSKSFSIYKCGVFKGYILHRHAILMKYRIVDLIVSLAL